MDTQIVEIQPRELKFTFELKKQSSCAVHLANVTDQYVAFKVKTTSPKKYCVRPNIGIIKPKSTSDFTVTMQAQKSAPSDMICKDKFLIQSTIVAYGTNEEEITPSMFTKDGRKYIEETKLRVVLTSAPNSPVKVPGASDGPLEQVPSYTKPSPKEADLSSYSKNATIKQDRASDEDSIMKDNLQNGAETVLQPKTLYATPEMIDETANNTKEESRDLGLKSSATAVSSAGNEDLNSKNEEVTRQLKDAEETKLKLTKALEDMRSKLSMLNHKLVEAESTIEKLTRERNSAIEVEETPKPEMVSSSTREKSSGNVRIVRDGFPPLFVCMVALIALMLGSLFRA